MPQLPGLPDPAGETADGKRDQVDIMAPRAAAGCSIGCISHCIAICLAPYAVDVRTATNQEVTWWAFTGYPTV